MIKTGSLELAQRIATLLLRLTTDVDVHSCQQSQLALRAVPVPGLVAHVSRHLLHAQEVLQPPLAQLTAKAAALHATPRSLTQYQQQQ